MEAASIQLRRKNYAAESVGNLALRKAIGTIAESWMVETEEDPEILTVIDPKVMADLTVEFQRLLEFSGRLTIRKKYDAAIKSIASVFVPKVLVLLKQQRGSCCAFR